MHTYLIKHFTQKTQKSIPLLEKYIIVVYYIENHSRTFLKGFAMSNQQTTHKMPIYKSADFECGRCDSEWQADYGDIAKLRKNLPINCKHCTSELVMSDEDKQKLEQRFIKSEKLSKRAVIFTIPYFIICAIVAITYSGIATTVMLIIGFMVIVTMRSSLAEDGIDHFILKPLHPDETDQVASKKTKHKKK